MSDGASRHPAEETLAAFIEGTLAPPEIAEVAEHLDECSDCRTAVAETARFYDEEGGRLARTDRASRRIANAWWLAAAATVLIIIGGAIAIPLLRRSERTTSPIAILIDAAPRDHRGIEPRVSGFPWARLQAPSRGNAPVDPGDLKLTGAAGVVLEKTAGDGSAASQHAAGVAYLLIARPSESVAALDRSARASNDARVWNDLAAVHYTLATTNERPSHLPLALAAADRALRLDANLAEAHFNRALILEHLGIRDAARKAWQRYLELDPSSGWSVEARARLRQLDSSSKVNFPATLKRAGNDAAQLTKLVREFPQESRSWGEGPLLAAWAEAEIARDRPLAASRLEIVRTIATALVAQNGEGLLADAVAAIDGTTQDDLARAQQLYHLGRVDFSKRALAAAAPKFRRAAELFREGHSPMADVAAFFAASATLEQGGRDDARDELSRIYAKVDRTRHRALTAQIQWERAIDANMTGDWGAATREATSAAAIFRALGERVNAAYMDVTAAHSLELMGERDLAWKYRLSGMSDLHADAQRSRRATILHSSAFTLAAHGELAAAESMMDVLLGDRLEENPSTLAEALADRASLAIRNGDASSARAQLAGARSFTAHILDPASRDQANAWIDLVAATLETSPRTAIATLDRVAAFLEQHQRNRLPYALLERARAHHRAGDDDAALADYAAAARSVDAQRSSIADDNLRLAFLDTTAQIVDESVELQLARGNVRDALAIADGARAGHDAGAPLPAPVAKGVALIEYAVLPRSLVIFSATADGIDAKTIAVDHRELAALVASFADDLRRRANEVVVHRDAAALHRLLIEPLRLSGIDELIIIPDRELYGVPFAALYDAQRRGYLIEDFAIRFAPAAAMPRTSAAGALTPALVVADPPSARWPKLEYGRAEAEEIAALHGATLLAGDAATCARFLGEAPRNALIHYSGHADSDATRSYGALLFAGDDDRGALGDSDIARTRLPLEPLVVLAACGTFRGDPLHVAGMSSIARAFLTAGARAVVGTLWEIDDDVAAPLFLRFHEELHAGAQPARALRSAQLAMLQSADARLRQPATWSGHVLLGSP